MKRISIAFLLLVLVSIAVVAETSAYYPVRVVVVKVYSHSDGFRVLYRKGSVGIAELYIPSRWFLPGGKAELVKANDPSFPYLTVFYKDGQFDHLRLYVQENTKDQSWAVMPPGEGVGKFESEDLKLQF